MSTLLKWNYKNDFKLKHGPKDITLLKTIK